MSKNIVYSTSESDASESNANNYCIFLHIVEGIGLNRKEPIADYRERHKDKIILNASLNGVKFEVEGHATETATIFNSNCIWECELDDIKRMKTDNRPVKLEFYCKPQSLSENTPRTVVGSLLLPIRGVPTVVNLHNTHFKLHWHKLSALNSEWRLIKPEIYLLLTIVKKTLIDSGHFEALLGKKKLSSVHDLLSPSTNETALMLQSQRNVYVQLLEQVGLIQVGNNPDIDCDIFQVTLTFKQVKHLAKLLQVERNHNLQKNFFVFHYDFLGSASHLDIFVNESDCYTVNERITLSFKSSLKSLRIYFQRIFYIPINLCLNGVPIANYRLDMSKYLPDNLYFNANKVWTKNGTFHFDRLHRILSPHARRPSVDFIFSMQLLTCNSKKNNYEMMHMPIVPTLNETYEKVTTGACGGITEFYRNLEFPHTMQLHKHISYVYDNCTLSSRNYNNNMEMYTEKNYTKANSEPLLNSQPYVSSDEFVKEASTEKDEIIRNTLGQRLPPKQTNTRGVGTEQVETEQFIMKNDVNIGKANQCIGTTDEKNMNNGDCDSYTITSRSVGCNTEPSRAADENDELTVKIVQELEEWKAQQMDNFLTELERKEIVYLHELDSKWEQQYALLQARLDVKEAKCAELDTKLQQAHMELKAHTEQSKEAINIADTVKNDIERNYEQKFQTLDTQMQRLKMEMQHRDNLCEAKNREVQKQNTQLERENAALKERCQQLEQQLVAKERMNTSAEQLKEVLADLRIQNNRFADMEKSKNYYKEQWVKATRAMHKLKLNLLKQQQEQEQKKPLRDRKKHTNDVNICLEEILNDEQEALNSDRSELKSIKELLFITSDSTSSICDFD